MKKKHLAVMIILLMVIGGSVYAQGVCSVPQSILPMIDDFSTGKEK